jgi:hypothetical protein
MLHKPMSVVGVGTPFKACLAHRGCQFMDFPSGAMNNVRNHGAIPVLSWSSEQTPMSPNEPAFRLKYVLDGRYDGYIRKFALGAKRWRHPFFMRFDWEMNGNWFPWGQRVNSNNPLQFVQAWQHVHHLFRLVGATNVSWVWCPNIDPGHYWTMMRHLWPGNGYVDWTCLDGYNWGSTGPGSPGALRGGWQSFNTLYRISYNDITRGIAPSKPMIIGEVGSAPSGGKESNWIANMLYELPRDYPRIHGFVWYDGGGSWHFPLRPRTAAVRAFARGLRSSYYAPNVFCKLVGGPIAPPPLPSTRPFCSRY